MDLFIGIILIFGIIWAGLMIMLIGYSLTKDYI
mgnify:FL=1